MKIKQLNMFFCMVALMVFAACSSEKATDVATEDNGKEVVAAEKEFGVAVATESAISLASLEKEIGEKESLENMTVTAKVTDVCKKKGCWMKLEKADGSKMHVTFKDYALFMPKDIVGKEVVIHGKAMHETVSVETLQHYAEDAGKSKAEIAAITEPEFTLAFEADGVQIQ